MFILNFITYFYRKPDICMDWIRELLWGESAAATILIYSIIISLGVFLGKVRISGVSLGITFVLFAGILAGHIGFRANHLVVEFIKDFGLILFVFAIGLQVGPGFFASFRKGGLTLNMLAILVVLSGVLLTVLIHFLSGTPMPVMVGIMSGAVTNTPGLGSAQQALSQIFGSSNPDLSSAPGLGYAVAYPFGVLGIILTMILLRRSLKVDLKSELSRYNSQHHPADKLPERVSIQVTSKKVCGRRIRDIMPEINHRFVISRILHNGDLQTAGSDTVLHENDIILVVAPAGTIPSLIAQIGIRSTMDLAESTGTLVSRRILVTRSDVFGKKLGSLKLRSRYNINITRVNRSGIELVASPDLMLQMGDKLTVVGDEGSLEKVTSKLGNSVKRLNEPNIIPIFFGILAGVIIGSIPVKLPGVINPIKLGLAGGPLIVAILMSKYGHRFQLVSYTTPSANLMLRELGIVLFLASVGLTAGQKFVPTLLSGDGFIWMGYGAVITLLPILITGLIAGFAMKRNYLEICGLLAGSMTDPPALAYANGIADSEAPAIAYATVYPLVMFLRIFAAQILILLFL